MPMVGASMSSVISRARPSATPSTTPAKAPAPADAPPSFDVGPAPPRTGPVVGLASKCLDVRSGGTADGTQIQLYTCNGSTSQTWTRTGSTLRALGKCLDVSGSGTADGTKIQLWTCNGTGAQNWRVP